MTKPETIAFVCLHGSAKSVIAAEVLTRRAAERGLALSATASGIEPDAQMPPHVVAGLREQGYDVAGRTPAAAAPERLAGAGRVIAFGCDPGLRDRRVEQWADCPAVSEDFGAAWRYITARVESMLDSWKPGVAAPAASLALGAQAASFAFDADAVGSAPAGWTCGVTGKGTPRWLVEADASAPASRTC
jgi:hypothetical protein